MKSIKSAIFFYIMCNNKNFEVVIFKHFCAWNKFYIFLSEKKSPPTTPTLESFVRSCSFFLCRRPHQVKKEEFLSRLRYIIKKEEVKGQTNPPFQPSPWRLITIYVHRYVMFVYLERYNRISHTSFFLQTCLCTTMKLIWIHMLVTR